ncbi:hypothetical protein ABZ419_02850 [Streptomyces cinnamoneus]|uniref:hypothetical protein n=1 Tax=Streptomyces cinnamoneus TaxID=53446 RepID=UPI0033FB1A6F
MDFNISADEDRVLLDVASRLEAGPQVVESEIEEADRPLFRSLITKGWIVGLTAEDGSLYTEALTPLAQAALSNRRDV